MNFSDLDTVSLIIPAWNGARFIEPCLRSLYEYTQASTAFEIVVIDNGSTDDTAQHVRQFPDAKLIHNTHNTGFAHAVNQGLHAAQGKILILLNQDVVATPNWLPPILARFRAQASAGIIGSKLLYPDGQVQHAGGYLVSPSWEGRHYADDQPNNPIDFVTGAAFAIQRACWQAVGNFDEGFSPAYYEDVDYCLRAKALGWAVVYEPQSVLFHHESQSKSDDFNHTVNFHSQRFRCVLKHMRFNDIVDKFFPGERQRIMQAPAHDVTLRHAIAHMCFRHLLHIEQLTKSLSAQQRYALAAQLIALRQFSLSTISAPNSGDTP